MSLLAKFIKGMLSIYAAILLMSVGLLVLVNILIYALSH